MNQGRALRLGRRDDLPRVEVAVGGAAGADRHRRIGHADMGRVGVGLGEHRDRRHSEGLRRTYDAAGDLATIGDKQTIHDHLSETNGCLYPGRTRDVKVDLTMASARWFSRKETATGEL